MALISPQSHCLRRGALIAAPLGIVFSMLGLAIGGQLSGSGAALFIAPAQGAYALGQPFAVNVMLSARESINAAEVTLAYPPELLEVVEASKQGSVFGLWIEEPEYRDTPGVVHFSGGVPGRKGFAGEGKLLTVLFRSRAEGEARVVINSGAVLSNDGTGTDILLEKRAAIYHLTKEGSGAFDIDHSGAADMGDVGAFVAHWGAPYDAHYDLDGSGKTDMTDLLLLVMVLLRHA